MAALLDDRAIAERIFSHIEAGTTDLSDASWREPVENYRSQARFDAELARVLRRTPTPFCPAAALAEPGAWLARTAAGTPVMAVRGDDGRVRAFRNACRHRGMQLVEGAGCGRALACRYHGWTYGLDGALRHVPHADGFPGLDRSAHGLSELPAFEKCGLVFVAQDAGARDDGSFDGLPDFIGADQRMFHQRESLVPANWKIFLEGFLEGYHIKTTHPTTFYPFGFDNLNVVETFGRNSRVTFPFQRIRKLAQVPPAERRVRGALTYVYHLFPNAIVTTFSHHTQLLVLEPVSLGETRLVAYLLTNRPAGDATAQADAERDAAFVNQTGGAEDAAVVCAIQRGLASGANDAFTYGRFEGAISHFHRALHAALSG
ncbi:MAG TPA: SRPBCC family protein [Myxococcota bacterium]|nr:SRPBCC family protein [Myxococcota bacterium]